MRSRLHRKIAALIAVIPRSRLNERIRLLERRLGPGRDDWFGESGFS
jgi:hypothetical protein